MKDGEAGTALAGAGPRYRQKVLNDLLKTHRELTLVALRDHQAAQAAQAAAAQAAGAEGGGTLDSQTGAIVPVADPQAGAGTSTGAGGSQGQGQGGAGPSTSSGQPSTAQDQLKDFMSKRIRATLHLTQQQANQKRRQAAQAQAQAQGSTGDAMALALRPTRGTVRARPYLLPHTCHLTPWTCTRQFTKQAAGCRLYTLPSLLALQISRGWHTQNTLVYGPPHWHQLYPGPESHPTRARSHPLLATLCLAFCLPPFWLVRPRPPLRAAHPLPPAILFAPCSPRARVRMWTLRWT